jgi:hypothetical protein
MFALGRNGCEDYAAAHHSTRWAAVTLEGQIIEFLHSNRGKLFCDDCLRRELQVTRNAALETATKAIGGSIGFRRITESCEACGATRIGTKVRWG